MKTAFSRTFFTYAVILLAALLLVGVSFQMLVRSFLTDKAIEGLKTDSSAIAQVAAAYYLEATVQDKDFFVILSVASSITDADMVICDPDGTLLLCSNAPLGCEHQGLSLNSDDYLQQVFSQEYVVSSGIIDGLYQDARYVVSTSIRGNTNEVLGIVIVSKPMESTMSVLKKLADT